MLFANSNGKRVEAYQNGRAECPCCNRQVIAKCGSIVTWHWAHEATDCDPWYEPESEWHILWKNKFPKEWQEVVIGCHRADIKTPKIFVELQSSCISPKEIQSRERFYQKMIWLLRGHDFSENINIRQRSGYLSFRWKWPRKSWWAATMPIVIDLPGRMIHVKKLHSNIPCGGWAKEITEHDFMVLCGFDPHAMKE